MLLCRISCEIAGFVHQPVVGSGQTNLSHLYFSRLSLAMPAKLNFFKTPTSVRLVQVGPCPLPREYQAATSHTGRQPCQAKSLYMKRFWFYLNYACKYVCREKKLISQLLLLISSWLLFIILIIYTREDSQCILLVVQKFSCCVVVSKLLIMQ
jgi:hypothetical protein